MKILNKILGMALLVFLFASCAPGRIMAQQEGEYISDQEFYDELQPYGTWVYDPQYGNVWVPDVEEDFRPYATRGYWAMTDYGNTWVSDYPWGWATFHYGRWRFDDYYGWEWVPGNEWAPAWVSWRNGGGYYGWAPLEPGASFNTSFSNDYYVPDNYWVFAPYAYINYTDVYNYYVPYNRTSTIIGNTTWLRSRYNYNNRVYYGGPSRNEIQRYSNRPVRVYNVNNASRPSRITVNNNNINIYRPNVRPNNNARPNRVVDGAAYRQQNPNQRIGGSDRSRGTIYNPANATKLAEAAKNSRPDSHIIRNNNYNNGTNGADRVTTSPPRTNNGQDAATRGNATNPGRGNRPIVTNEAQQQQRNIDRQQNAMQQQQREQQRQQRQQQTEQQKQQAEQQRQQRQQQTEQQQQQAEQQRQQRQQQTEQQKQQAEQQREQQRQQRPTRPAANDGSQQQQQEQQRQQQQQVREQQRQQQQEQQRQQQRQQQQQQEQQRQQQQQVREQQRQQQQEQQRQQQQQVREQQQQEQQRQQQEQQRQQQEQQRQQQQRQQQEQQRQQQQEQQRQQQSSPAGRPVRN